MPSVVWALMLSLTVPSRCCENVSCSQSLRATGAQKSLGCCPEMRDLEIKASFGQKFGVVNKNTKFKINKFLPWLDTGFVYWGEIPGPL